MVIAATTVFPDPTSPSSSRFIGWGRAISCRICQAAIRCALVSWKGKALTKPRAVGSSKGTGWAVLACQKDFVTFVKLSGEERLVEPDDVQLSGIVGHHRLRQLHPLVAGLARRDVVDPSANRRLHAGTDGADGGDA